MMGARRMMAGLAAMIAIAAVGVPAAQAQAAQPVRDAGPKVGDRAPAFEALSDEGRIWRSRDHVGKGLLVVYFYPAAMTSGCTKQACAFRDNRSRLQELGAEVVGVSGDRIDGLRAFKGSNRLNFPLLSDTAGTVARAFGVPVRAGGSLTRTIDGREQQLTRDVTAARWTFIIDRAGRIVYRDTQADPDGDGEAVIRAIQRLRG